jgi:hypothetical protein
MMKQNHVPQNPFAKADSSPRSNNSDDQAYFRKVQVNPNESEFIEIKHQMEIPNPYKTDGYNEF